MTEGVCPFHTLVRPHVPIGFQPRVQQLPTGEEGQYLEEAGGQVVQ